MNNKTNSTAKTTLTLVEEMRSIMEILEKENNLICARDYSTLDEVRIQKTSRLRSYQNTYHAFLNNADLLREATEAQKAQLKETAIRFSQEVEKNARLVKTALQATQSLLQTIMNAARKDATKKTGYADLRKDHFKPGYDNKCNPVAVCRTV